MNLERTSPEAEEWLVSKAASFDRRVGSANPNIVSEYELTPTETQMYLQTVEKQEKEH